MLGRGVASSWSVLVASASRSAGSGRRRLGATGADGITATGTGKVKAVPDVATVSLGVSATAPTAPAARRPPTRS